MKHFSIPADFKKETIDKYDELNKKYKNSRVSETYGCVTTGNVFGSGRLVRQMLKTGLDDLQEYIEYSREKGIDYNYTLNPSYIANKEFTREGVIEIKKFLNRLYEVGVRCLTVSIPSLMELVRETNPDFKIRVSTICRVNNVSKAMFYKSLGASQIVLDESINRKFSTIKDIREAFDGRVEILANQLCDLNCIYRMFHYNMISSEALGTVNDVCVNFFEHRCVLQQFKDRSNLLKLSWIRPEDLKHYSDVGIEYFKLQGRHTYTQGGDPVKTAECYLSESFDGNLMDLITMFAKLTSFSIYVDNKKLDGFLEPFYKNKNFCDFNCVKCDYCETFARKSIDYGKAQETMSLAREFYNEFDQYKKLLHTAVEDPGKNRETAVPEIEFDL